jgi:uncharacterized protein YcbX
VQQAWRYPVKSMGGEAVPAVELDPDGVVADRAWAVRDEEHGALRSARKLHGLLSCTARYPQAGDATGPAVPEITLPDGSRLRADAPDAGERISAALGHPVTLWPLRPKDDLHNNGRGPGGDDPIAELRTTFALEPDDPLPDLSVFPPELARYVTPPGTYVDAYPLLLLTEQSLAALQRALPASVVDLRRFRPSLLIDAPGADYPEQAWVGHRLRVGAATVEVVTGCPRCVMTTLPFADLPADRGIMRGLVRETAQLLGVYAAVVEPGPVRVGDAVTLV